MMQTPIACEFLLVDGKLNGGGDFRIPTQKPPFSTGSKGKESGGL
jgi:hypothetical protein